MSKKNRTKKRAYRKSGIKAAEFVRIWQKAKSLADVVERTGISKVAASHRASVYRSEGVTLQQFQRGGALRKNNYSALAKLAQDTK